LLRHGRFNDVAVARAKVELNNKKVFLRCAISLAFIRFKQNRDPTMRFVNEKGKNNCFDITNEALFSHRAPNTAKTNEYQLNLNDLA
jgi:hypothetical protein